MKHVEEVMALLKKKVTEPLGPADRVPQAQGQGIAV